MNEEQKAIAEEIFYMFDQEHITPIDALTAMAAPPANNQSEQHLEMVNAPAPSVPDEELQAAFDRGLKAGNEQKEAQQVEIHRLHDLLAAPTQAEAPADVVRDAARLDWLDERNAPHGLGWEIIQMPAGNVHIHTLTGDKAKFGSIRDAIDAAMSEKGGKA